FSPKPLKDCSIAVNIKSQVPIKSLYSPTHNVDTKIDMKEAVCGYEETNVKPDKNFVMYYTVSQKDLGLNLLTFKEKGKDGYFLLMMSPGEYESKPIPKDILFIMDTSGSMKGKKMKQAREALKFCVNSLAKDDNFNIISFATGINTFEKNLQQADSKKVDEAIEFIEKLEARGGTNINDALKIGLKMFSKSTNPRMIVFLTDGEPTVGMTDMKDIVKNIKKSNKTNTRIFVFGVGNNVNTHLLDKIAQNNKGVPEYVIPKENIELKVSSFYKKISQPVISDIELDFGKIKTSDIYPIILPDVFQGTQLIVLGRYTKSGASAITLSGNVGKEQKEYVFEDTFTADSEKNDFIPRIWASRKIGYLVSEIRLKGENKELIDEVVKLSKEFGIMTPYTSFLVLEKSQKMDRWELSENVSRSIKRKGQARKMAMDSFSGSNAVRESKSIQSMRQTNVAVRSTVNSVKSIGSKTFFLKYGGIWTDSNYKDQLKTKKIKYMSTEFFQLLKDIPELGKYFVLGSKLIVIYKEQAYQVVE
ncbi:VWA domain-containing protein, partial [bacterium]|nr:VWA domain-containing protein [bacterium]